MMVGDTSDYVKLLALVKKKVRSHLYFLTEVIRISHAEST